MKDDNDAAQHIMLIIGNYFNMSVMMMHKYSHQELFGSNENYDKENHVEHDMFNCSLRSHQVYLHTLSVPGVWLFTLVSLVAALLPDVVIRQIHLS